MKIIKFAESKKIFAGWNCWLSQITIANNIEQRQSKRARQIQITRIKKKVSKTGSVSWKINFLDLKTKKNNSRSLKFTEENELTINNFSICITKEKAITKHNEMLYALEQTYRQQLANALEKIKEFREEF